MNDAESENKVVSLDRVRLLKEFKRDPSVAYIEILFSESSFAVNAAIRDLEAMRRGTEEEGKPLREPETEFEAEILIKRMRWVSNYLAREWGIESLVRAEDWQGDERASPEDA